MQGISHSPSLWQVEKKDGESWESWVKVGALSSFSHRTALFLWIMSGRNPDRPAARSHGRYGTAQLGRECLATHAARQN